MTTGFDKLSIGDDVEVKGPMGFFVWLGAGAASWRNVVRKPGMVGLICGGSGETDSL